LDIVHSGKVHEYLTVYDAYYKHEHSPEYQAVQLFKTLTLIAATENIEAVAWYEIKDLPPDDDVIGDNDNNRYLGCLC
jgi:hypothetical protein